MEPALAEKMKEKKRKHIKNILWQSLSAEQEWSQEPPGTQHKIHPDGASAAQKGFSAPYHRGPRGSKEAFVGALHMVEVLPSGGQTVDPSNSSSEPCQWPILLPLHLTYNRYTAVVLKLLNFNCILMILVYTHYFHCCICKQELSGFVSRYFS